MSWITLSFISAMLLGCYDIAKKASVRDNAVPMVLLLNVMTAAAVWSIPIIHAALASSGVLTIPSMGWSAQLLELDHVQHALLFGKSAPP